MTTASLWQKSAKTAFFVTLWAFTLFVATECCWGATAPIIGKMPPDQDTEVGSDVSLNCTLLNDEITLGDNSYRVNSSMITFKFNNHYLPSTNVDIFDPYTATLKLKNATADQSGLYYCFVRVPGVRNVTVCVSSVNIGYPPQPVQSFECKSMNLENLTCFWKPQDNKILTNYTLQEIVGGYDSYSGYVRTCPAKISSTSCQWRLDTSPPYRQSAKIINMRLLGNNSLGAYVQNFKIDNYKIVLPGAPEDFKYKDYGTTYVMLQWQAPKHMEYFNPGLIYQIQHGLYAGAEKDIVSVNLTKNTLEYNLTDLVPFTLYAIRLRCISSVADSSEFWSQFSYVGFMTSPDKPYKAPEVSPQGFEVQNFEGNRSIKIYWKLVPRELHNGENFQYAVSIHPTYTKRPRRDEIPKKDDMTRLTDTFSYYENLDANTAYQFTVRSANNKGTSTSYSTLIVDKKENMPSTPMDITAISWKDGVYEISWKPPSDTPSVIVNYTVFWCQNVKPRPYPCEGMLDWKYVKETRATLTLPNNTTNYQFAVSANTDHSSSGMEWASCLVPYDGILSKIEHVTVEKKNSTSLKVIWQLVCNAQKAVVTEYQILACVNTNGTCRNGCTGPQQVFLVRDPQATSYVLTGLTPFTYYGVKIRALTMKGRNEDSDMQCESTMSGAPSDPPHNITVTNITQDSVTVHWLPPMHPNGEITKYAIYYNKHSTDVAANLRLYTITNLRPYEEYTFRVGACVGSDCSNASEPVVEKTDIGAPERMEQPQTDNLNSTHMILSWKPPLFPNGPLDFYQISVFVSDDNNETFLQSFNVSGQHNSTLLAPDCSKLNNGQYFMLKIQAGNYAHNETLLGPLSSPTQARFCRDVVKTLALPMILGFSIGGTLGLAALVFVLYFLVSWMKRKVDLMKDVKVQLPKGLDSPYSNPLNSYENFMNGLIRRSSTNLSPKLGTPAPNNFTEDEDGFKNRHGSGNSQFSASSTDELLQKKGSRTQKLGRNPSGESSGCSSGCHDSLSSTGTHHTNVSSDSGTEVDIPNNNVVDAACTVPKGEMGPDATYAKSGAPVDAYMQCSAPSAKYYVTPYSLFGTEKIPLPQYSRALSVYSHNLANSEPSVANLGLEDELYGRTKLDDENWQMYSKFGLSSSTANVRDLYGGVVPTSEKGLAPYSRFGVCNLPYVTVGMALKMNDREHELPKPKKVFEVQSSKMSELESGKKDGYVSVGDVEPESHEPGGSYSMFGIQEKAPGDVTSTSKGYVSFQDAHVKLNNPIHPGNCPEEEVVLEDDDLFPSDDLLGTLSIPEIADNCELVGEVEEDVSTTESIEEPIPPPQLQAPTKNGYVSHDFVSKMPQTRGSPPQHTLPDVVCCAGTEWRTGTENLNCKLPKDIPNNRLRSLEISTNECGLVCNEV